MRVAIVTDIHVGARSDSKIMANHFAKFYTDIFFPTLEEQEITRVLMLGDIFDRRKYINFQSLHAARNYLFEPLRDYEVDVIVGNHDTALKSTNEINSLDALFRCSNHFLNRFFNLALRERKADSSACAQTNTPPLWGLPGWSRR